MKDRTCFASVDIEHDLNTAGSKTFYGVEEIDRTFNFFEKFNVSATLFVTGDVLEKYPEKAKEWVKNYEIASHSYKHVYFNELSDQEKETDINTFIEIYRNLFGMNPRGFRAPSHVIDSQTFEILEKYGFLYDSSVVPHYPPFRQYRGYRGRAPLVPHKINNLVEVPVSGQLLGIPLAGAWIRKLPVWVYRLLFTIHRPSFITLSIHSWDILDSRFMPKLPKILEILKENGYVFKSGEQIAMERLAG